MSKRVPFSLFQKDSEATHSVVKIDWIGRVPPLAARSGIHSDMIVCRRRARFWTRNLAHNLCKHARPLVGQQQFCRPTAGPPHRERCIFVVVAGRPTHTPLAHKKANQRHITGRISRRERPRQYPAYTKYLLNFFCFFAPRVRRSGRSCIFCLAAAATALFCIRPAIGIEYFALFLIVSFVDC
jgi:hypothetical protein